jgi:hypothetical protein
LARPKSVIFGVPSTVRRTLASQSSATPFIRAVKVDLGGGADTLTIGAVNDPGREARVHSQTTLLGGADQDTFNRFNLDAIFAVPIEAVFENGG